MTYSLVNFWTPKIFGASKIVLEFFSNFYIFFSELLEINLKISEKIQNNFGGPKNILESKNCPNFKSCFGNEPPRSIFLPKNQPNSKNQRILKSGSVIEGHLWNVSNKNSWKWHVSLILALVGAPRADLHVKPPSTMDHESVIQRRPSLSHPGWLKYFFQTYNPLL